MSSHRRSQSNVFILILRLSVLKRGHVINELGLLLLGLLGLWLGATIAVNGAKRIALHFGISSAFIGLTILSVGTSVPEMAISVAGGLDRLVGLETSGLVVGNAVGSAINQLTLILGIVAIFGALFVKRGRLIRDGIALIGSILVVGFMALDGQFSIMEGYILVALYLIYLFDLFRQEKVREKIKGHRGLHLHIFRSLLGLAGGILLVVLSSNIVVKNGIALAEIWGVSQTFVGIFITGLGTGLPELAVSFAALRKGERDMSVSNLIGSNICDLLLSLGAGTIIAGFFVSDIILRYDLPALLLISLAVIAFFWTGRRLTKKEGIGLIVIFLAYLIFRLQLFG